MASTVSFKLLAIGEPAAYFLNPLAAHADLTRTVARIHHRQREDLVAFATRAFLDPVRRRTMRSNSHAAQQLASDRQLPASLSRADGFLANHTQE
jgi:hypothetical protein